MKIRRDIASVPARSARDTWRAIVDLVTGSDTVDRDQLDAAASIMESVIADEQPSSVPIIFKGAGPRVVVYCLYDEDAMEAGHDIDPLSTNPTAGDWRATAPCENDDVDWMNRSLKERAPRILVHPADEAPPDGDDTEEVATNFQIDWGTLEK